MSRFNRSALVLSATLVVAWLALYLAGPWIVSEAYYERSLPFLNDALTGRDEHPLDHYLGLWRRAGLYALAALVVGSVLLYAALRNLDRIIAGARGLLWGSATVRPAEAVWLGVGCGILAGSLEGSIQFFRSTLSFGANPANVDIIWLAALPGGLVGGALAFAICLVLGRGRRPIALRPVALALTTLVVYSALDPVPRVQDYAKAILAVGAGVQLSALMVAQREGLRRHLKTATLALSGLVLVCLLGLPAKRWVQEWTGLARTQPPPAGAPNVLLVILDTVRAKSMSLYGYDRPTTPEIDRFASTGVVFDAAMATAPWTLPSHASMFTGRLPYEFTAGWTQPLDDVHPTVAEAFTASGYATGGFVANYSFTTRRSGLARGFLRYDDYPYSWERAVQAFWATRSSVGVVRDWWGIRRRLVRKQAEDVNSEFLGWVDRQDRPFFAFLNYFDAHDPYEQNQPYTRFWDETPRYWAVRSTRRPTTKELEEFQKAYDGTLTYLDYQVGQLMRELDERDLLENTIVVISSDHGEQFGEHGLHLHSNSLYLPVLHVPLIVAFPRAAPAGVRVQAEVSIQDIGATLLGMAGLDQGEIGGRTLSRYWEDVPEANEPVLAQASKNVFSLPGSPVLRGSMASLFQDGFHYIMNGDGVEELYEWTVDPEETRDLTESIDHGSVLLGLRGHLERLGLPEPR